MKSIVEILTDKKAGIDSTEAESAEIKGIIRDMIRLFPEEFFEAMDESHIASSVVVRIGEKTGIYTGFSKITNCHHFSMYDGSTIKRQSLATIEFKL